MQTQRRQITDSAETRLQDLPEPLLREVLRTDHLMSPQEIEDFITEHSGVQVATRLIERIRERLPNAEPVDLIQGLIEAAALRLGI